MRGKRPTAAVVGLLTAAGLTLTPLTTAPAGAARTAPETGASAAATAKAGGIDWKRCKDRDLRRAKARCGYLTVPLDHANPTGRTIKLAVSRVKHTKKPFKGAVFTNPGGPGGGGTGLATLGQYVPKKAGLNYDWYGMDLRGDGASRPALSCNPRYFGWDRKPYRPSTQKILDYWLTKTARYAADCGTSEAAELLPHLKTIDNVRDFESLRQAIGQSQVTFYGFSYGTYIAQVYATLYPGSLKAMILDGVVDASRVWYQANLDQDYAFAKNFNKFFAWVAENHRTYRLGKTRKQVEKRIVRLEKRLTKRPAEGKVGPSELDDSMLGAGYLNLLWPSTASAISKLANDNDATEIREAYRNQNPSGKKADNAYAMYLATICTDAPWPKDWSIWAADNNAADKASPFFAWANAWFNAPCRHWPAPSATPVTVSGAAFTGPVLLTSETFDAATPFAGALATRALFPTSSLIEGRGGTSHAVTLFGISCTDNAIAAVLKSGKLPVRKPGDRADKRCPALGAPTIDADDADRISGRVLPRAADRLPSLG